MRSKVDGLMPSIRKAVIVTGANGSIGTAIVKTLLKQGMCVVALDKSYIERELQGDQSLLREPFDITEVLDDDFALSKRISELLELVRADELFGLVNNAAYQHVEPYYKIQKSAWTKTFETNVFAPAILAAEVRWLLAKSCGAVVNIGSVHEVSSKPHFTAYASSKSALSAITRGINLDEKGAIRVFTVAPGAVDTPMLRDGFANNEEFNGLKEYQPLGRIASPEEVAEIVANLILSGSSLLSGSTLRLDGGIHGRLHDPA